MSVNLLKRWIDFRKAHEGGEARDGKMRIASFLRETTYQTRRASGRTFMITTEATGGI